MLDQNHFKSPLYSTFILLPTIEPKDMILDIEVGVHHAFHSKNNTSQKRYRSKSRDCLAFEQKC